MSEYIFAYDRAIIRKFHMLDWKPGSRVLSVTPHRRHYVQVPVQSIDQLWQKKRRYPEGQRFACLS